MESIGFLSSCSYWLLLLSLDLNIQAWKGISSQSTFIGMRPKCFWCFQNPEQCLYLEDAQWMLINDCAVNGTYLQYVCGQKKETIIWKLG